MTPSTATELLGGSAMKPTKPFRLTRRNYYSPKRPHISSTQLRCYLKSPSLYHKRYVEKLPEAQFVGGDAVKRGSIVDAMLTGGKNLYSVRVLKRDDPELYAEQQKHPELLVSQTLVTQAQAMASEALRHPAWSEGMKKAKFQVLLEGEIEGVKVCGLADRVDFLDDGSVRLIDLKSTSPSAIRSARTWFWHSWDFRLDVQMAEYRELLAMKLGIEETKIRCYHFVVAYVEPGLVKVKAYEFPEDLLARGSADVHDALKGIAAGKFNENLVTWEDAELLAETQELGGEWIESTSS